MKRNIHILVTLTAFLISLAAAIPAGALPADFYAKKSVLAEGRWVRIEASKTGMTLIPAATLRAMGFQDISKVNVYGTGGEMLSEALNSSMTDDLPLLPCERSSKGIVFFATDHIKWLPQNSSTPYSHLMNPYSEKSYYFLSDREPEVVKEIQKTAAPLKDTPSINTFTERLLHETETTPPSDTGRVILGEDFRSQRNRSFPFTLAGLAEGNAMLRIAFGACSSTPSSILVTVDRTRLPSTTSDNIPPAQKGDFMRMLSSVKTIENPADRT